jgi:tetratricopeptide (TPR) repeat protein
MRRALALAAALCGAASAGAADLESLVAATAQREGTPVPEYLQPWIQKDKEWGQQHRVLLQMAAGRSAFLRGDWGQAEALLADAQREVETIYANNPQARAARKLFVPESSKDFKGDPYERAMLGIYLGLIDLSRGEFDNARAGFRFAQLQDTMSASEDYQDDMALAQYLVGWSYWCEGDRQSALEEFERARRLRPGLKIPAPQDRLLMLAEVGAAPVKFRAGQYGELQRMRAGAPSPLQQVGFRTDGRQFEPAALGEDILFQASTRGGAAVDAIRAGKASFRRNADAVADVGGAVGNVALTMAAVGSYTGKGGGELAGVGLVAGVVALAAKGVASSTEAQADIRYWINLPERIYAQVGLLPAEGGKVETGFYTYSGKLHKTAQGLLRMPPRRQCGVYYSHAADAQRGDGAGHAQWPALPPLDATSGVASQEHLIEPDDDGEGGALLDAVRRTREGR